MKRIYTILTAVIITASIFLPQQVNAQAPQKMTYQAVIRNASDQLVTSQGIGMQISILQGSATGTAVYVETHNATTNANGLVTVEIGNGTVISGDFGIIDWANDVYFIKTETDPTQAGGTSYTITGTSQLLSVAYALHAKTAESITGSITETDPVFTGSQANNITATGITNLSNLSGVNTGDQTISRTGLTVTLTNGGTYQDSVNTYTAGTGIDITNNVVSLETKHYVGELYGGGIVYYVYDNGQHGLIASLNDLDGGSGVAWSATQSIEIGASAKSFYDGASNTVAIVAQDNTAGYAATLCDSYTGDSQTDWYLPASWELNLLYNSAFLINKILENDGDGATNGLYAQYVAPIYGRYWSSTESIISTDAWACSFNLGHSNTYYKYSTHRVRAVRAF